MTTRYSFTLGLGYPAIVAASERVAWTVDGVFRDRAFDASRAIVPSSWTGADGLRFLDDRDRLVLNHCRAFSYVHLLRNFEEFAPPHLVGAAADRWHDDRAQLRAILRFGEEEIKHQQLFRRAETILEASCGHAFRGHFDADGVRVRALTRSILGHSALARYLMVLALEWGTQRHYVESVRGGDGADALYTDVLKAHWIEEAQHTKTDALEIARLAKTMNGAELSAAFDDVLAIGALVDAVFAGQARAEVETLAAVRGRALGAGESRELARILQGSLSAILAGVGLGHPRFAAVARELSAEGSAKLGIA